jgi:hypothetical protein
MSFKSILSFFFALSLILCPFFLKSESVATESNQANPPISTRLHLFTEPNPSLFSQDITLIAKVHPSHTRGIVVFFEENILLGSARLNRRGEATLMISGFELDVGEHVIKARYEGQEGKFLPSRNAIVQIIEAE